MDLINFELNCVYSTLFLCTGVGETGLVAKAVRFGGIQRLLSRELVTALTGSSLHPRVRHLKVGCLRIQDNSVIVSLSHFRLE